MTCEECEERVFELIEREATDPDGVRQILSRCPDCRTLFDAMKAGLAEAQRLPREEPSAETDAAILRLAGARASEIAPRRRRVPGSHWAIAAAALLAVSVGVWSIPQTAEPPASPRAELPREVIARRTAERTKADPVPPDTTASLGSLERPEVAAVGPRGERARKPSSELRKKEEQGSPAAAPDRGAAAIAAERFEAASDVARLQQRAVTLSPPCRTLRQRVEQIMKESDGSTRSVKPEQALSLGRCYRAAGDVSEARRWLEMAASHPETKRRASKELRSLHRP